MTRSIDSLVRTSWAMAVLAVGFGVALVADPRQVEGVPAWLKPAKFAASLSVQDPPSPQDMA